MTGVRIDPAQLVLNLLVALGGALTALPFVWMITASFKTTAEIFGPPTIWPGSLDLANYLRLFADWPFLAWYRNSLIVAVTLTLGVLFFCSLAGFAFAKYRFKGRSALFLLLLGTSMIPFPIILIPLFVLISRFGWNNELIALIVPFLAPAVGIFLMRQFILSVPDELIHAARIDGASELRIYWQIIVPMVRPGLATLAIITFLTAWNNFLWPLVVLRQETGMTLPIGLANMLTGVSAGSAPPYGPAMAASTLISVPMIVLFLMVQRHYIAGLTVGAVKQ